MMIILNISNMEWTMEWSSPRPDPDVKITYSYYLYARLQTQRLTLVYMGQI